MPIKHLVVLMLENRAFDHALGELKTLDPRVNGLTGTESNPLPNPPGGVEQVAFTAPFHTKTDPGHEYDEVVLQLFGGDTVPSPPVAKNQGFVRSLAKKTGSLAEGRTAMHGFNRARLPTLYTLAQEYAVCDNWFSSVPGPTWPNRFFAHAASSRGSVKNSVLDAIRGKFDQPVIYENLSAAGLDWRIYFADIAQSWALKRLRRKQNRRHYRTIGAFDADARGGNLPPYTFIEPRYFDLLAWKATDQHPGNHVELGEHLIARVYDAVRASPLWNDLLLVIVYDEHGGLFDHEPPPYDGAIVNGNTVAVKLPDKPSDNPKFRFDRLGPRVPAVLVSPRIPRGTVDHTVYEHASIPATVKEVFGLPTFLNPRDATVNTFAGVTSGPLRTDRPVIPRPAVAGALADHAERVLQDPDARADEMARTAVRSMAAPAELDLDPLNDLQKQLLELANHLEGGPVTRVTASFRARVAPPTETDAAMEVRRRVAAFLAGAE